MSLYHNRNRFLYLDCYCINTVFAIIFISLFCPQFMRFQRNPNHILTLNYYDICDVILYRYFMSLLVLLKLFL
jgi:hypothetical protein